MTLSYKLEESDFLAFQLYNASQSESINKKRNRGWAILTLSSLLFALYFYYQNITAMVIYFGAASLLFGLFYKKYFLWRYRRHYSNHIKENYKNRVGLDIEIRITDDFILTKDKTGEGKIKISEIKEIVEIQNHIFGIISTGETIIVPKSRIRNYNEVIDKFTSLGLKTSHELDWSWK